MAAAARELAIKIAAVSPDDRRRTRFIMSVFAAPTAQLAKGVLAMVRRAITERRKLAICYRDLEGRQSSRTIRPLHLEFWGQAWTLTAWCEKRSDFRVFRCDRLSACEVLAERFQDEKGKDYASFLALLDSGTPHVAKPR
jgi:predicted DNA-binding transcriptional regulator YafY